MARSLKWSFAPICSIKMYVPLLSLMSVQYMFRSCLSSRHEHPGPGPANLWHAAFTSLPKFLFLLPDKRLHIKKNILCVYVRVCIYKYIWMRWAGHVARMGEERGDRILVGKSEGKRPLGRPRGRWVDNIRMDLQEVGCGYVDWIGLAQDRDRWRTLVSTVMNLRVPWNAGNFLTSCKPVSFSRRTLHHGVSKYGIYYFSKVS